MIEVGASMAIFVGTSLVAITAAFARAEVKQNMMEKKLQGKAEKDIVEVKLEAMNGKLDLIIDEVRQLQRR